MKVKDETVFNTPQSSSHAIYNQDNHITENTGKLFLSEFESFILFMNGNIIVFASYVLWFS